MKPVRMLAADRLFRHIEAVSDASESDQEDARIAALEVLTLVREEGHIGDGSFRIFAEEIEEACG